MSSKYFQLLAKTLSISLLCCIYYWLGYEIERSQFWLVFMLYSSAFALSGHLYFSGLKLSILVGLSFVFKLIFLFSIPELSQDFYRFIWDGMLTKQGVNPYLHLPSDLIKTDSIRSEVLQPLLFENMGDLSAHNYSTYPPIAQLLYHISYSIGGDNLMLNVVILRLFNLSAEVGALCFGLKILKHLNLPKKQILFFIMNPLVILESSFSLHFEVVMLFFLALSIYYISRNRVYFSALGLAGAIVSKMLPLMFLPLVLPYFNQKSGFLNRKQIAKYLKFTSIVLVGVVIAYGFLWDSEIFSKSSKTLSLYFTSFEFNASIYYVLRWLGYLWSGYNRIEIIGTFLSVTSLVFILYLSFKNRKIEFKRLLNFMLFTSTAYYLLSTTVHPWYLMLPLFLSIFTQYKYMLAWSWLVFLSYSAYKIEGVEENQFLISIEYAIVIGMVFYEVKIKNKLSAYSSSPGFKKHNS